MSTDKNQSAIREVRDQLFIDTADGGRLTAVTDNLGFYKPLVGFHDDNEWRAIARALALGPKQIEWAFRQILDVCVGPDYDRTGILEEQVLVGDTTITLEDASDLVQVGTLILSPGQAGEESIDYCFVDRATNKVFLNSPVINAHAVTASAENVLATSAVATATSLVLYDSSLFPTTGYPYSISIGKGTVSEEYVTVSNNDTGTNTLTVSALTNDHSGFKSGYLRRVLLDATFVGRVFLKLDINDTAEFPETGWLRLDKGTASEEIVFYTENSLDENIFYLKTPLQFAHASGASIELVEPGDAIETINVIERGVHWSIYDTSPREVKILVPESLDALAIIDASWLHDAVPATLGSTTLAVATTATDTVIELASAANFPDEAGMLTINGTDRFFYTYRDEGATPNPTLTLTKAVGAIYPIGTAVTLFEVPYGSTLLEEGNPRDVGGSVIDDRYPGPYLYDPLNEGPGLTVTTITSLHPAATEVVNDILVGRETLEAKDLSLWPNSGQVRVGRGSGYEEDLTYTDVTLRADTIGSVVSSGGGVGTSTIVIDVSGAAEAFPEIVGTSTAQYLLILDEGGGNEEIVTVIDESLVGPLHTLTIQGTFSITHAVAETAKLVYDVLTVDATTEQHFGINVSPTARGHFVEYLTDTISLTTSGGFPATGGTIYLNYGDARPNYRTRLTSIVTPTVYEFVDTSGFPTSDFPYQITLGEGTHIEEKASVTANDTGLNRLTFSAQPVYTHSTGPAPFGEYAAFSTGGMELIEYQDVDVNDLILSPAQVIGKHTVGEYAMVSSGDSIPRVDGYSYPFYLPPDKLICIKTMFELVRAAGIQVTIITF